MDTDLLSPASHSCQRPAPRGPVPSCLPLSEGSASLAGFHSDRPLLPHHQINSCKMEALYTEGRHTGLCGEQEQERMSGLSSGGKGG